MILKTQKEKGKYTNFNVAIYIPASVVQSFKDADKLTGDWELISRQVMVDKVYIEVQRNRTLVSDELLEKVKKFFLDKGVRAAGGMALSNGELGGQFRSFCYTDPADRAFIKQAVELAARHFDEIIQDDFLFVTTKYDSDIIAKGNRSWTDFRLDLMREASENLLLKPAKSVNPKVKMVIKYPNWYEHFQGSGFDLDIQAKMFDGIYTGTETRDPENTDQNLQQYESYLIYRYFENIKPGGNGGGWVDTYSIRYVDRYAEQLWNTMFAKAKEITLFEWSGMTRPIPMGERIEWIDKPTNFNYDKMLLAYKTKNPNVKADPTYASVASYSLEQVDTFLDKLGKPIGIKSYKPYQSRGEDYLHNYFGNMGIPIDLYPTFPMDANLVLLTESAQYDTDIVNKMKKQLVDGKSVVITSGLLHALQGKGIEDIVDVHYTHRKIIARDYLAGFGAGSGTELGDEKDEGILFPDIRFLTNDSWPIIRALANGRGYPLMLLNRYSKGILYIWVMPDNFNDLYQLPVKVTSAIKNYIMAGFPIRLDGPSNVALFAYDNDTFIVQSYLPTEIDVSVSLLKNEFTKLRDLVTNEEITDYQTPLDNNEKNQRGNDERRVTFNIQLLPHSYKVYAAEKDK